MSRCPLRMSARALTSGRRRRASEAKPGFEKNRFLGGFGGLCGTSGGTTLGTSGGAAEAGRRYEKSPGRGLENSLTLGGAWRGTGEARTETGVLGGLNQSSCGCGCIGEIGGGGSASPKNSSSLRTGDRGGGVGERTLALLDWRGRTGGDSKLELGTRDSDSGLGTRTGGDSGGLRFGLALG